MEYRQLSETEYKDLENRILFEDNHLIIIYKKVGEIAQGDKTGDECLSDSYKAFIARRDSKPGKVFLGVPHRLDRTVEGIFILAKTSKALSRLTVMFSKGEVHKIYRALCCNKPDEEEGLLENYIVRNEKQNKSYIARSKDAPGAKSARLKYKVLLATRNYYLIEIELLTGRHHQIRCQLSHIGCPIKGDLKYGAPRSNPDGGICLQSREVRFIHPVTKIPVDITVPSPKSWKGVEY